MKYMFLKIVIIFLLACAYSLSQDLLSNMRIADKIISSSYNHDSQNQLKNINFNIGFHVAFDDDSQQYSNWTERERSHVILDYLNFGLNFKMDIDGKLVPEFNFKLFDFITFENLRCSKYKFLGGIKLFNFETDINFDRKISWIEYKHGYGYDFINKIDKQFIPFIFLGIGYNSYKINENSSNLFSDKFSNFELIVGSHIYLLLNPISFEIKSTLSKITDSPNLDFIAFSANLRYIKQELIKYWNFDWGYDYYLKDFAIYFGINYFKFIINNESEEFVNFKLGLDYYFQNER